jgi:hypothetical protein
VLCLFTLEPSPFTPLLSFRAGFQPKWQPEMLISPGTDPLRTHFVTRLNEWVHIGEVTAPAASHCKRELEHVRNEMTLSRPRDSDRDVAKKENSSLIRDKVTC